MKNTSAIVLAAGKGTRLNQGQPSEKPKVLYEVAGKPMIDYSIDLLAELGVADVVVVVGHLGEQIEKHLGKNLKYVHQPQTTGTGEAVRLGLENIDKEAEEILVLYGADIYHRSVIENLLGQHRLSGSTVSFLTKDLENSSGYGRIVRDEKGNLLSIVEEKVATQAQKKIREVNDGAYLFKRGWLSEAIKKLKLTKVNEYFLTDLVEQAVLEEQKVLALKMDFPGWFGVDTPEQILSSGKQIEKWHK